MRSGSAESVKDLCRAELDPFGQHRRRELENVIERSVILSEDGVIHSYHRPPSLQTLVESGTSFGRGLEAKLRAVECEMIIEALKTHKGNTTEAAHELNLTRRVLGLRMAQYNLDYRAFMKSYGLPLIWHLFC